MFSTGFCFGFVSFHNHLFLIAHVQKIGVLQAVISDEYACNRNSRPSKQGGGGRSIR